MEANLMKTGVQVMLRNFLDTEEVKPSQLARAINYTPAVISQYLSANGYKGDITKLEKALTSYITNYDDMKVDEEEEDGELFVETRDASALLSSIKSVMKNRKLGAAIGAPGTGKTTVAEKVAYEFPNVILFKCASKTTDGALLRQLCRITGTTKSRYKDETVHQLHKYFERAGRVLLFDEAENLTPEALETVRQIWDFTKTPVFLLGTQELRKNLQGPKRQFAQMYSRITNKWLMKGLNVTECSRASLGYGLTRKAQQKTAFRICEGNFRYLDNLLSETNRLAELNGKDINEMDLEMVSRTLEL